MRSLSKRWLAFAFVCASGLAAIAFFTRDYWLVPSAASHDPLPAPAQHETVDLSPQARKNLGIGSKQLAAQDYWRTIQVPGLIVDRPGVSDRGITAPAVGVVARIHAFPGETVKPGARLVTLRLNSEYLQHTQSELFKTRNEMELVKEKRDRLAPSVKRGAIPEARLIEVDQELRRLTAATQSYRQDLLTRGLSVQQVEEVGKGKFASTVEIKAPPLAAQNSETEESDRVYEVQELKAELGQQVQAGQLLCVLADHQSLYIEGHSFKREARFLEQATQLRWPVRVEFNDDEAHGWPPHEQAFIIRHLANTLQDSSHTLKFYLPLANQSRRYEREGQTFLVWRFRPGQHVRLHVPVEEMKDVIVLPAQAVVRDGPEAYVFRQNGDLFNRLPVHLLHEDRTNVVLAQDDNIKPGVYLAQQGAAALNRVLKAQNASGGLPPGAHFHADGSLHIP